MVSRHFPPIDNHRSTPPEYVSDISLVSTHRILILILSQFCQLKLKLKQTTQATRHCLPVHGNSHSYSKISTGKQKRPRPCGSRVGRRVIYSTELSRVRVILFVFFHGLRYFGVFWRFLETQKSPKNITQKNIVKYYRSPSLGDPGTKVSCGWNGHSFQYPCFVTVSPLLGVKKNA